MTKENLKNILTAVRAIINRSFEIGIRKAQANGNLVAENFKGIILNSSTTGSTKKYRITVDDTGTISATEVT